MNYIGKFFSNFKDVYNEINPATLTGAIDAVVVRQEDGSYLSSPFHVRFGKIGVLRSREKVVDIEINGLPVDIHMKLGESGEAFFVEEIEDGTDVSDLLGTSPLPNYHNDFSQKEDDVRSQDSGVDAEEVYSKALKDCSRVLLKEEEDLPSSVANITVGGSSVLLSTTTQHKDVEEHMMSSDLTLISSELTLTSEEVTVNVPNEWRQEELHRSKSLTNELSLLQTSTTLLDTQGSKTDVEDSPKSVSRSTRRRRKKRAGSKKRRSIAPDCPSSENSTTSETADLSSLCVTGAASSHDPLFLMDNFHTRHIESNRLQITPENLCKKDISENDWPRMMGPDFHPFSDTDISPPPSLHHSRCHTPVKSDTEYECEKQKSELNEKSSQSSDNKWSWTWGELPTPPQEAQRSMFSMFNFMRATRKARRNPENDGIYLDDLKLDELDPEVAALYFPRNNMVEKGSYTSFRPVVKDDDVESGNGASLPQSPHSMDGAIGGMKITDSDYEDSATKHPIFYYKGYHDLCFSACGALHEYLNEPFPEDLFMQSLVTYDEFCENPDIIYNPNLVIRLDGKYMNWATAAPQILSLVLFQRPLPQKVIDNVAMDNMPKKEMRKRTASKGYSWFSWGRNNEENQKQSGQDEGKLAVGSLEDTTPNKSVDAPVITPSESTSASEQLISSVSEKSYLEKPQEIIDSKTLHVEDLKKENERIRNDSSGSDGASYVKKGAKKFRKTMRLSNDQIEKLNLKYGSNEVVFSVTTAYQGTTICKCHIFLWNYDEKIVISDIDGTITKSDVLGHILPIMGKDWAQGGVAQLFTKIKNNGYHFLYLSARAIGQARITREYLRSIKQGDVSLPDGPLLLNPTSLISAFHREVIEKKPEEFKISCLRDIKALFPISRNPFYAGYGNRVNDVWAYSAVGIPISRIFTINHRGELKHELTQAFQTTYSNLSDIAHHMFPPAADSLGEYSSLQYWRIPLPEIYIEEIEKAVSESSSK